MADLLPVWQQLQDTERLLRGCARDIEEVQPMLLTVSVAELTDIELWTKARVGYNKDWDDVKIENMHRLLLAHDLIWRFQVWLGPEVFSRAARPPSS